jgi:hypothetical protein
MRLMPFEEDSRERWPVGLDDGDINNAEAGRIAAHIATG